jgi:DNA-binding NtrC family response regulator
LANILHIEDNPDTIKKLESCLGGRYNILRSNTHQSAIETLTKNEIIVIIINLKFGNINALNFIKNVKEQIDPYIPILVTSDNHDIQETVNAMKSGAFDFINTEFIDGTIEHKIEKAIKHRELEFKLNVVHNISSIQHENFIFVSDAMKKINLEIARISKLNFDVLLIGETGTGKDLLASQIHKRSNRCNKPFLSVSLKGLSENLIESELFGHEKGSFTGAIGLKVGLFESANGGTLYIPEIASLNHDLQLKLLHFMQYKTISRVGQDPRKGDIKLDVRIIFATNKNLEELVNDGSIREDFYYRISGIKLYIPPLRERFEDIEHLAKYFLDKYTEFFGMKKRTLSDKLLEKMKKYYWKGNVRELSNSIKQSLVFSDADGQIIDDIPNIHFDKDILNTFIVNDDLDYSTAEKNFRMKYYKALMEISKGKISDAAGLSGLTPQGIRKALKILGIDKDNRN